MVLLDSKFHDQITRFSAISKISISAKLILMALRSILSMYNFSRAGVVFFVCAFRNNYINEKMSSLAGLGKITQSLVKVPILAIFGYLGPHIKPMFTMKRQNFKISLACLLKTVARNIVLLFELSIFEKLSGGLAVLQVDIDKKPWL